MYIALSVKAQKLIKKSCNDEYKCRVRIASVQSSTPPPSLSFPFKLGSVVVTIIYFSQNLKQLHKPTLFNPDRENKLRLICQKKTQS